MQAEREAREDAAASAAAVWRAAAVAELLQHRAAQVSCMCVRERERERECVCVCVCVSVCRLRSYPRTNTYYCLMLLVILFFFAFFIDTMIIIIVLYGMVWNGSVPS